MTGVPTLQKARARCPGLTMLLLRINNGAGDHRSRSVERVLLVSGEVVTLVVVVERDDILFSLGVKHDLRTVALENDAADILELAHG